MSDVIRLAPPKWVAECPPDLQDRWYAAVDQYNDAPKNGTRADQLEAMDEMTAIMNEARQRGVHVDRHLH